MSLYKKKITPEQYFGMTKTGGVELPKEENKWGTALHTWLKEEHPYLSPYAIHTHFKQVDSERGYGVGSAAVARSFSQAPDGQGGVKPVGVGPVLQIPLIVEDFSPKPVAAFSDGKKYRVLTERNVHSSITSPEGVYSTVPKVERATGSAERTFTPPESANRGFMGKQASAEERSFARRQGVWVTEPMPKEELVGSVVERTSTQFISHDVFEKEGSLQYLRTEMTYPEAVAAGVAFREGRFKTICHKNSDISLTKESSAVLCDPVALKQNGPCYVYDKQGTPVEGLLVTEVRELDGSEYPGKLLLTKEGHVLNRNIYGGISGVVPELNSEHKPGGSYSFIYKNAATVPLYIDHWDYMPTGTSFDGRDMNGRPIRGHLADVKSPAEVTEDEYLFPKEASCVPLGKTLSVLDDSGTKELVKGSMKKEARINYDGSYYRIPYCCDEYMLEGKARAYLAAAGSSATSTSALLKTAQVYGTASFYVDAPKPSIEKKASTERLLSWVNEEVLSTMIDGVKMVKEAGLQDDKLSVDHILNLQFVTPDNIKLFTDQIPQYEDTISGLCQVSLGGQLGASVDSAVAAKAASYLDRVVNQLGQQKPYTETT